MSDQASAPPPNPGGPPSHILGAVLVMIFCCLPGGIISLVYGLQVGPRWRRGDVGGARDASAMAERWMYASVAVAVIAAAIWGGFLLVSALFFDDPTGVPQ